jgi:hypothetical protein
MIKFLGLCLSISLAYWALDYGIHDEGLGFHRKVPLFTVLPSCILYVILYGVDLKERFKKSDE